MNGNQDASGWMLFKAWGICICVLQLIFAWCTASFGLAYSNLAYRKVVTWGPYYFTQHPAYVVKLLSFAMLSVPWVDLRGNAGRGRALRNVICLLCLGGVYVLRAATEERHLMAVSEEYRDYSRMMAERWGKWGSWCFR